MKLIAKNIVNLWFAADTPVRQFKIKLNPQLWLACQKVNRSFKPPSGATQVDHYKKSDKLAFAEAVLSELNQARVVAELNDHCLV